MFFASEVCEMLVDAAKACGVLFTDSFNDLVEDALQQFRKRLLRTEDPRNLVYKRGVSDWYKKRTPSKIKLPFGFRTGTRFMFFQSEERKQLVDAAYYANVTSSENYEYVVADALHIYRQKLAVEGEDPLIAAHFRLQRRRYLNKIRNGRGGEAK